MNSNISQNHSNRGSQGDNFLILQKYIEFTKDKHAKKLLEVIEHTDSKSKKKRGLSLEQRKILENTRNNIFIELIDSTKFYGMNAESIQKYYDIFKISTPESTTTLQNCLYIFEKMGIEDIRLLSNDMDYELFQTILMNKVIIDIGLCHKQGQTKDLLNALVEDVYINIVELDSYKFAKKTKHFADSANKLEKYIKDFLNKDGDGIKKTLQDFLGSEIQNNKAYHSSEKKEFLVAIIPFMLEFYHDFENFYRSIVQYVYDKWSAAIDNEIQANKEKNNSLLQHKENIVKKHTLVEPKEIAKKSSLSLSLSEGEQAFITYVQDVFDDQQLKIEVGKYLTRIFKKNNYIKIFQWFEGKNIILTENERQGLESLFRQFNYVESSYFNENSNFDSSSNLQDSNFGTNQNIVVESSAERIDSIQDALVYFKDKFSDIVTIDELSLLKQYELLPLIHQNDFINSVNKVIANPKLWRLQYNYIGRTAYYKISLLSGYRFALEKESGKVFLGSHAEYETWLGR